MVVFFFFNSTFFYCKSRNLFIYLHQCRLLDSNFFPIGYNPLLSIFIVMFKLSQIWPLGALSSWLLCPFDMLYYPLSSLLYFGTRYSSLILCIPCLSPGISHFSREIWFLFIGEWYLETKIQVLGCYCY